jgi:hypothetical protein
LQDGVRAILDHAWGDGILLTDYEHSAGSLEDSFMDQGRRHLVIDLKREMAAGEQLEFKVARTAMEGFRGSKAIVETTIDHPIAHLTRTIVFPKGRPVQRASFATGVRMEPLRRTSWSRDEPPVGK